MQRLTFMRTDTTVKARPVLAVHLGDATSKLGPLTYSADEINRALERDATLGAPLREHVIRPFHKPGMEGPNIQKGPMSCRKRVVSVFLSSLPKELATSIVRGVLLRLLCHFNRNRSVLPFTATTNSQVEAVDEHATSSQDQRLIGSFKQAQSISTQQLRLHCNIVTPYLTETDDPSEGRMVADSGQWPTGSAKETTITLTSHNCYTIDTETDELSEVQVLQDEDPTPSTQEQCPIGTSKQAQGISTHQLHLHCNIL